MRFEFIIGIFHLVLGYILVSKNKKSSISWIIVLTSIYGPLYSLIRINSILTLSVLISTLLFIILISRKLNKSVFIFILILTILFISSAFIGNLGTESIFKTILILLLTINGFLIAEFIYSRNLLNYALDKYSAYYAILAIIIPVVRSFNNLTIRDAGLPTIAILFAFYSLYKKKYIQFFSVSLYFFLIQTRTTLVLLFIYFLLSKRLFKNILSKAQLVLIAVIVILPSSYIIYSRSASNDSDNAFQALNAVTRLNAIEKEFDDFRNNPLIGKGVFYFDTEWKKLLNEAKNNEVGDLKYIAYNHIGITSVGAQLGIIGVLLLVLFPSYILFKMNTDSPLILMVRNGLIIYILSFFVSGSPLRTDFLDQLFFGFLYGYSILVYKQNK